MANNPIPYSDNYNTSDDPSFVGPPAPEFDPVAHWDRIQGNAPSGAATATAIQPPDVSAIGYKTKSEALDKKTQLQNPPEAATAKAFPIIQQNLAQRRAALNAPLRERILRNILTQDYSGAFNQPVYQMKGAGVAGSLAKGALAGAGGAYKAGEADENKGLGLTNEDAQLQAQMAINGAQQKVAAERAKAVDPEAAAKEAQQQDLLKVWQGQARLQPKPETPMQAAQRQFLQDNGYPPGRGTEQGFENQADRNAQGWAKVDQGDARLLNQDRDFNIREDQGNQRLDQGDTRIQQGATRIEETKRHNLIEEAAKKTGQSPISFAQKQLSHWTGAVKDAQASKDTQALATAKANRDAYSNYLEKNGPLDVTATPGEPAKPGGAWYNPFGANPTPEGPPKVEVKPKIPPAPPNPQFTPTIVGDENAAPQTKVINGLNYQKVQGGWQLIPGQ